MINLNIYVSPKNMADIYFKKTEKGWEKQYTIFLTQIFGINIFIHQICLLRLYILEIHRVISGWLPTRRLYSVASLEHHTTVAITRYRTQSQYRDTKNTIPHPILVIQNARLSCRRPASALTDLAMASIHY